MEKPNEESEDEEPNQIAAISLIDPASTPMAEDQVSEEVQEVSDTASSQHEHLTQNSKDVTRVQSKQKYPKVKDIITCLIGDGDDAQWFNVHVDSRGGKAKGKNKDYYIVKYDDESNGGVHLDQVPWGHQPSQV